MKLFEVRDLVRENVGRDALEEATLDWCVRRALRELEKRDNFYWMEASANFQIYNAQQAYSVTAGDGLNISDLKDIEAILVSDRTASDPSWCSVDGPELVQSMKTSFTEADSGPPAFWTLSGDGETLSLWPPAPQQDYLGKVYYWKWTELPSIATSEAHEVLKRWPEALIYLAVEQGMIVSKKDMESANYWRQLFEQSEYRKITVYQQERKNQKRFRGSATNATSTNSERLLDKQRTFF